MRNGKHYIQVRLTPDEKERFVGAAKQCNAPEKTIMYWMMEKRPVREYPPEKFFKLHHLLLRITTNISCIWCNRNLPEQYSNKYYHLSHVINHHDCNITFRSMFADPDYGNDREY